MRLHVPSLPHTQTTKAYSWCAYTQKVRRFCDMMTSMGHEVILYAGEENEADVAEHVVVVEGIGDPEHQINAPSWDPDHPFWAKFNNAVSMEIAKRKEPDDFICAISGSQITVHLNHNDLMCVEYGIGYSGVFAPFKVFESYAWMHCVYGQMSPGDIMSYNMNAAGCFYDAVIPNCYDPAEFPEGKGDGGYLLYIGRLITLKGLEVAADAARRADVPLLMAGEGPDRWGEDYPNVKYIGMANPERRAELMGGAIATIVPTLYPEPFGGVSVESLMCGTPVISTDWGGFSETIEPGRTGWRCRDLGEFEWAIRNAHELDRGEIHCRAVERFSTTTGAKLYDRYFDRVAGTRSPAADFYGAPARQPLWGYTP